jgi:hypothetical protein
MKSFDREVIESAVGDARAFTYSMDRAGDMPYNQNSMNTIMQFMQVPHKALTTMTFNRNLTKREKLQLAGLNLSLYGLPTAALTGWLNWAIGDAPDSVKEAAAIGLEGMMLNRIIEATTGEETNIDWKGLAPIDMYSTYDIFTSLWTEGWGAVLTGSPSAQLFFGKNPRITNAFKRTAAFFNDTLRGNAEPKDIMHVMDQWLSISSGYSNAMRARLALEKQRLYNSSSTYLMDSEVSTPEAFVVALGFNTMDAAAEFALMDASMKNMETLKKDMGQLYNDVKRTLAEEGIRGGDRDFALSVINNVWPTLPPEMVPRAKEMILELIKRDVQRGEVDMLMNTAWRTSGVMSTDDYKRMVESLPLDQERKDRMLSATKPIEED